MAKILKNDAKVVLIAGIIIMCILTIFSNAGDLNPSAPPGPTMKTLDEIYDAVNSISSEVTEREGFCQWFSIGGLETVDLVQVPEGKCFVLLKVFLWADGSLSEWELKNNDTSIIHGPTVCEELPTLKTMLEFPDTCVKIGPGDVLRIWRRVNISMKIQVLGYFYDI